MAAAAMAQGVPQIVTRGDNVMVQSGPTGDISFQTGSANVRKIRPLFGAPLPPL